MPTRPADATVSLDMMDGTLVLHIEGQSALYLRLTKADFSRVLAATTGLMCELADVVAEEVYRPNMKTRDQVATVDREAFMRPEEVVVPRAAQRSVFDRVRTEETVSLGTPNPPVGGLRQALPAPPPDEPEHVGPRPSKANCADVSCRREFYILPYGTVPTLCTDCRRAKNIRQSSEARRNRRRAPPQHKVPPGVDATNPRVQKFMDRDARAQR